MHNPPHAGEVLREWLGDMSVTEAAQRLGVAHVTLSRAERLLNPKKDKQEKFKFPYASGAIAAK